MFVAGLLLFLAFLSLSLPDVKPLANKNPSTTSYIESYKAENQSDLHASELKWKWVSLAEISPYLLEAVLLTEDTRFWTHGGIDWIQVRFALKLMLSQHQILTGASTITQQVARNLYLSSEKTLTRKIKEMLIALQLEWHLDKERILEIYVNIAEWGDGIFGIEAASLHWYQCHASELNPQQAIHLALALPNPHVRNPTDLSPRLAMFANDLLLQFAFLGLITDEEALSAFDIPDDSFLEELKQF